MNERKTECYRTSENIDSMGCAIAARRNTNCFLEPSV